MADLANPRKLAASEDCSLVLKCYRCPEDAQLFFILDWPRPIARRVYPVCQHCMATDNENGWRDDHDQLSLEEGMGEWAAQCVHES